MSDDVWNDLIGEVTAKDTGEISFLEFKKMMLKAAPQIEEEKS